jgi:hypothetical protein
MTSGEAVDRAQSMIGASLRHKLGRGDTDLSASTSTTPDGFCDCSRFVCWLLGMSGTTGTPSHALQTQKWINADAIVEEVKTSVGLFSPSDPKPNTRIVYPRQGTPRTSRRRHHYSTDCAYIVLTGNGLTTSFPEWGYRE